VGTSSSSGAPAPGVVPSAPAAPAAPAAAGKKFCPECGKEVAAGAKFCPACGAKTGS
jgi:membrane protease subunit (stomatin/prohibitin family)